MKQGKFHHSNIHIGGKFWIVNTPLHIELGWSKGLFLGGFFTGSQNSRRCRCSGCQCGHFGIGRQGSVNVSEGHYHRQGSDSPPDLSYVKVYGLAFQFQVQQL